MLKKYMDKGKNKRYIVKKKVYKKIKKIKKI